MALIRTMTTTVAETGGRWRMCSGNDAYDFDTAAEALAFIVQSDIEARAAGVSTVRAVEWLPTSRVGALVVRALAT